ncbi:ABC transporter type 1, transmembrane domain-containing protein [Amylostereum chailletii]|nr:ABC transporter type 1, transmembrane domain-containing protein [Amylostereum chailletii]
MSSINRKIGAVEDPELEKSFWLYDWGVRARVVTGIGLLLTGKLSNVQVPLFFKEIIDALQLPLTADSTVWIVCGSVVLVGPHHKSSKRTHLRVSSSDGTARIGATLFSELLNAVFAKVGQRAIRKVVRETFDHLLHLDLKFHLSRQTGGLTRAIDRGITFVLQAILFRVVPTALEISLVCGILTYKFGWDYAAITLATMGAYTWFTCVTEPNSDFVLFYLWPSAYKRTDSWDVQHLNNEQHEIRQYDKHLIAYEKASVKIASSLVFLNSGQNIIFSTALTGIMFLAAQGVINGAFPFPNCAP